MSRGVNNMKLSPRFAIVLFAALGLVLVAITDRILPGTTEHQARAADLAGGARHRGRGARVARRDGGARHPDEPPGADPLEGRQDDLPVARDALGLRVRLHGRPRRQPGARPVRRGRAGRDAGPRPLRRTDPSRSRLASSRCTPPSSPALTARFTKLLPTGWWLKLHRFALVVLALAWTHGVLAGTDTLCVRALLLGDRCRSRRGRCPPLLDHAPTGGPEDDSRPCSSTGGHA